MICCEYSLISSTLPLLQDHYNPHKDDDVGALTYVVVVILIYACSILMMIASYIRKNNVDQRLQRYLKEMAHVRKRQTQIQLLGAAARAASIIDEREMYEYGRRDSITGYNFIANKLNLSSYCRTVPDIQEEHIEEETEPLMRGAASGGLTPIAASICVPVIAPAAGGESVSNEGGGVTYANEHAKGNATPKAATPKAATPHHEKPQQLSGLSSMMKGALMSGLAVGMWEGSKEEDTPASSSRRPSVNPPSRRPSITITYEPDDEDDEDDEEEQDADDEDDDEDHLLAHSPAVSDQETTPGEGPSERSSSTISKLSSSSDGGAFSFLSVSPDLNRRKGSHPAFPVFLQTPSPKLKRHSVPSDIGAHRETDLSFLDTKFLRLDAPRRPSQASRHESFTDIQVVTTV